MTRKTSRRRARRMVSGRGALVTIAALLIGSAIVRLGDDAGQAFAKAGAHDERVSHAPDASSECKPPDDLHPMLIAFQEREENLTRKELALEDRMQALKIANREIEQKLNELTSAEDALRATIALADTAAESDLDRLTRVYESMKPKQAAALFEEMDPNFAAGFLGRMRPEAAAAVMAGLSPESAHMFSIVLAGRNAAVPKD